MNVLSKVSIPPSLATSALMIMSINSYVPAPTVILAAENAREREYLYTELFSLGYDVEQSHANFIYMPFEDDEYKEQVFNYLKNEGLLICNMSFFRQKNALRITVGDREVNQRVVSCLKDCSKENMSASSVT